MIASLPDFEQKIILLQYRAQELGVAIDCSPKRHLEIAGDGIEFCWGPAKNKYRRFSFKERERKEIWFELVEKSTCNKDVLNTAIVRLFERRIRGICYLILK